MKAKYLFPYQYKFVGWTLTILFLLIWIVGAITKTGLDFFTITLPFKYALQDSFGASSNETTLNLGDEFIVIGLIVGMILIAFSKEKVEDEYVSQVRLETLQWAIYINFVLLIVATIFVYGTYYFNVMIYNMFTPLLFFIGRFYYVLYLKSKIES
ncbi:hypothetical protein VB264_01740 [Arcicella aquatica]|uniref:Uncharacterized protein n=1 Tax=Arcicella aquatica TaxID=217141 RepID=A0ABU5QI25_9BACT|nr:hypothetical protein [Arcicella aquatica]MEA5256484.1 hypothetical protein [Arcicella aquatica]